MAQYTAVSYDSYITMGYAKENMWSQDLSGNGKTMQDNVKDGILTQIQTNYLLEDHMKDYGVEITDEELSDIDTAAQQFMDDNSKEAIRTMGAKKEYVATTASSSILLPHPVIATEAAVTTANASAVNFLNLISRSSKIFIIVLL